MCFWVPYMELSCFLRRDNQIFIDAKRSYHSQTRRNEINYGQNQIPAAFICGLCFTLVHRSITDDSQFVCVWFASIPFNPSLYSITLNRVCVSLLLLSNKHDWYTTTTFLLLRKFAFLLLCFKQKQKNQSFTAHHQFVINIHLVSSVLCLWGAQMRVRSPPHVLFFYSVSFLSKWIFVCIFISWVLYVAYIHTKSCSHRTLWERLMLLRRCFFYLVRSI